MSPKLAKTLIITAALFSVAGCDIFHPTSYRERERLMYVNPSPRSIETMKNYHPPQPGEVTIFDEIFGRDEGPSRKQFVEPPRPPRPATPIQAEPMASSGPTKNYGNGVIVEYDYPKSSR